LSAHFNPATLQVSFNIGGIIAHEPAEAQEGHAALPIAPLSKRGNGNSGLL
jgi:hypothetical protein